MIPVIAIIGRPNVGKSTLFNRLTSARNALVSNISGLTRDRQYGEGFIGDKHYIVIDTGGLSVNLEETNAKVKTKADDKTAKQIEDLIVKQALQAASEANCVLFLVDARSGLNGDDEKIASLLRRRCKNIYLVVNKIEGLDEGLAVADFYSLGLGEPHPISAEHSLGVGSLIEKILSSEDDTPEEDQKDDAKKAIKIAVIGRPNAGKSTLVNRILGEERVIVSDVPGTTRDSISIDFTRRGKNYVFIDTAGVRQKSKIKERIEKFSVIKTLKSIYASNVVIMLLDAKTNLTEQDLWLLGFVLYAGKALVIAVNKWDNLQFTERDDVRNELDRRLSFVYFAKIHFISALYGSGVGNLFASIDNAYKSASRKLDTPELTNILQNAVSAHEPPMVRGRRIKLRYAHSGGRNPPLVIIHGNQVDEVSEDYRRYLEKFFLKALNLSGTPLRVEFKRSKNPYI